MSSKLRQLIFLSILVASCLAEIRFFPNRYKHIYPEETSVADLSFRRYLQQSEFNSQNENGTSSAPRMVSMRIKGDTELGYYYITLFFGSPLQRQTLIVDTGSSVTAIPCGQCDCGPNHFDKPFDSNSSETFQEFGCQEEFGNYVCSDCNGKCYFHIGYAEGSSYNGNYKKDFTVFGNEAEKYYAMIKNPNYKATEDGEVESRHAEQLELQQLLEQRRLMMPFGCVARETRLFYEQEADGILGLGVQTNTRSNPPNLLDTFEMSSPNHDRAFSLCYAQNGGYFTVGGLNTAYHKEGEEVQYMTYYHERGQYRVHVQSIQMEGTPLNLTVKQLNSGSGAFFDSGTTYTHVPRATLNEFTNNLMSFCAKDPNNCGAGQILNKDRLCWKHDFEKFSTVEEFFASFPTFTFLFGEDGSAKYEWKAEDYFFNYPKSRPFYCIGITHLESETILGGTFMKNHDMLFDKNNKRLGFARANCSALNDDSIPFYKEPKVWNPPKTNEEPKTDDTKQDNGTPTKVDPNQGRFTKAVIVLAVGLLLAAALFIYVKLRIKAKYNDMANEPGQNEFKNVSEDSNNIQTFPSPAEAEAEDRVNSEFEI